MQELQTGDVVRGRRAGNRTAGNYVIGRMIEVDEQWIKFYGHNEYSGSKDRFIMLAVTDARVIRSYNNN